MIRKSTTFKSAISFPNRTIAHLYSQIDQQKRVLQCIHEVLPAALAKHVRHCVVKGKKLLVYTDTAAWASQLRFYNSAILAAIAPVTRETISMMQVKVRAEALQATPQGRKPNIPSAEQIEYIQNQSLTIADEQLRLALQKLSNTLEKRLKRQD